MKLRFICVASVTLVVALGLLVPRGTGQFQLGERNPTGGLELISDLHQRRVPTGESGRFRIVALPDHTLLLDSKLGDSWVLTASTRPDGKLSWIEVPRVSGHANEDDAKPADDAKPEKNDPFGDS